MNQLIITSDNSHTIYVPELNEHYHSVHGAVQESDIVFIINGLSALEKTEISILEIGFGTGLNAILTLKYATQKKLKINYTAVEKYPITADFVMLLNYPETVGIEKQQFKTIHDCKWNSPIEINPNFILRKLHTDLLEFRPENSVYDLIYFDAFAPEKQPNLWTSTVFKTLYAALMPNGILCTYSAKGTVKQALRSAGFDVTRLAGPPGKRHVLRAKKH